MLVGKMDNPQFWLKISQGLDIDIEAAKNLIGINIWLSYIPFFIFCAGKKKSAPIFKGILSL